jgi:hypothetical protein
MLPCVHAHCLLHQELFAPAPALLLNLLVSTLMIQQTFTLSIWCGINHGTGMDVGRLGCLQSWNICPIIIHQLLSTMKLKAPNPKQPRRV